MADDWCDEFWKDLEDYSKKTLKELMEVSSTIWKQYIDAKVGHLIIAISTDGVGEGFIKPAGENIILSTKDPVVPFRIEMQQLLLPLVEEKFQPFVRDIHRRIDNHLNDQAGLSTPKWRQRRRYRRINAAIQQLRQYNRTWHDNVDDMMDKYYTMFSMELIDKLSVKTSAP